EPSTHILHNILYINRFDILSAQSSIYVSFCAPYIKEDSPSAFYLDSSLQQAKEAAIESAILLKNDLQVLPLTSSVKSVAVVGPLADAPADQVGTWCFDAEPEHCVTPLTAIQQECENRIRVIAEPGLTYSRDKSEAGIAKAVAAARQADVILFFAGEEAVLSGEARCRADISLPGKQTEMLKALKATGKPVVLVIMAGRPLTIPEEVEMADAVLYNFHGGTMSGPAISDLLFGKVVPSGKLPVTLPRMVGQVPIYYAHKNTGRPASNITLIDDIEVGAKQTSIGFTSYHLDAGDSPLFPFGYGLSYTTFTYGDCQLSTGNMKPGDVLTASCDITNSGAYDAQEVVQLYIRDKVGSLVRPVKELKGFKKIMIKAGDTVRVNFTLTSDDLAYWNADMQQRAEAGEFTVWIAPDSQSGEGTDFKLTD
ncbi:glycoside hydrolase family 3 C-terminal domain-containing protein, partial [uncultured Bacteroides sp.]|uniref:glycoside hydrolase family 3 C-terminal domain-containing protein n=1 Tax=uncultured Bacteroides sp. TaxID=162156 RepID=UPI0025F64EB7